MMSRDREMVEGVIDDSKRLLRLFIVNEFQRQMARKQ
jgi:hypothetical protein